MRRGVASRVCRCGAVAIEAIATLAMAGCAYRLSPVALPSQHKLRLVAQSPEQYSIRVWNKEYPVGADGNVSIEFPATRRGCHAYLFDRIPISRSTDPFKAKAISVQAAGNTVRRLSLNELSKPPVDGSGNHLLKVQGGHRQRTR